MNQDNTKIDDVELDEQHAKQIASMLDHNAQRLSMRTLKKLADAREIAVNKHQVHYGVNTNADGTLSHWVSWIDHHRIAFVGITVVGLMSAFIIMKNLGNNEISDAFLLGADLPPEAFVDRGFEPSLNNRVKLTIKY